MANYLLLYRSGGMPKSDEEKKKVMDAWGEWSKMVGGDMVDLGNPCGNVKVVNKDGAKEFSGDQVTGYSVVKAGSWDKALDYAKAVPLVADGTGSCEVYETFPAM